MAFDVVPALNSWTTSSSSGAPSHRAGHSGSAAGLALPTALCEDTHPSVAAREVLRTYDARNRLKLLSFPDGNGDQSWSYTKTGLPLQVVTYNVPTAGAAAKQVVNTYLYNNRGLLTNESVGLEGWWVFPTGYEYDANASLKAITYPSGQRVAFNPNALGQPTHIASSSQIYASNVEYWPHGATKSFTYGNGIAFAMTPNERLLPFQAVSSVQSYQYHYDASGNPTAIHDLTRQVPNSPNHYSKIMTYDGLNRLTDVGSASFGGDHWHRFRYDVFDNMTSWTLGLGGKNNHYLYTPGTNRLQQITNGPGGPTIEGFAFDDQGNIKQKSGAHYTFDYGNRLRQAATFDGTERYRYDAHGRRALAARIAGPADQIGALFSHYAQSGQLLFQSNERPAVGKSTDYIYLGGTLLAERETSLASGATNVVFTHTDGLGSPVAKTSATGAVLERMTFDPYGGVIEGANKDGPGYTGHVRDVTTGMNYMQQRYYDPGVGLFLSIDPVTAQEEPISNFNRYRYANSNPFLNVDQDGELAIEAIFFAYKVHMNRNVFNRPHATPEKAQKSHWTKMPPEKSLFHQWGPEGHLNEKWVDPSGHHEAVYDKDGELVYDRLNAGTYNFASPNSNPIAHTFLDILPYLVFGNGPSYVATVTTKIEFIETSDEIDETD